MTFEEVWDNIQKHEGEIYRTKTGIKFSYLIKNERIYIVGYEKTKHFKKEDLEKIINNPELNDAQWNKKIYASYYACAILSDERIGAR